MIKPCKKELLERVLRMQKRAARIILDAERTTRILTMFMNLTEFHFLSRHIYVDVLQPLREYGVPAPDYINTILKTNSEIHNRSTRFANLNFHCPVFKKNTEGGRTFSVRTIRNWNELSMDVKKVKNVKRFKKKLYTNFIAKQKETGNFEYLFKTCKQF